MRRLNQLNATYFRFDANQSNIQLIQSNIRLKFDSSFKRRTLQVPNRIQIMLNNLCCSNGNLKHVARVRIQQFYLAKKMRRLIKSAERIHSSRLKLVFDLAHVKCDV